MLSSSTPHETQSKTGALWNPNAATLWSVLFSPAFGSYLQALNWRTLGQPDKAKAAMNWFYASIGLLVVLGITSFFIERVVNASVPWLLVWYFSAGKKQVAYVKAQLGSSYARRSWVKPLLVAIACMWLYVFALGFIAGVLGIE